MTAAIATPCVKLCVLDPESGFCVGCLRSREEIAAWMALDDAARVQVMAGLPERAGRLGPAARRRRERL